MLGDHEDILTVCAHFRWHRSLTQLLLDEQAQAIHLQVPHYLQKSFLAGTLLVIQALLPTPRYPATL